MEPKIENYWSASSLDSFQTLSFYLINGIIGVKNPAYPEKQFFLNNKIVWMDNKIFIEIIVGGNSQHDANTVWNK